LVGIRSGVHDEHMMGITFFALLLRKKITGRWANMGWSSDWVVIGWTGDQTGPSKKNRLGQATVIVVHTVCGEKREEEREKKRRNKEIEI
jgi:hypothetical protein